VSEEGLKLSLEDAIDPLNIALVSREPVKVVFPDGRWMPMQISTFDFAAPYSGVVQLSMKQE
jgi:hypothetical protein